VKCNTSPAILGVSPYGYNHPCITPKGCLRPTNVQNVTILQISRQYLVKNTICSLQVLRVYVCFYDAECVPFVISKFFVHLLGNYDLGIAELHFSIHRVSRKKQSQLLFSTASSDHK